MPVPTVAHRQRSQKGSSLIEFSLVLLPLMALLLLTLNLAWLIFSWASVQEGVREGVRYAITGHPDAAIVQVVQQHSFGMVTNPSAVQVHYYSATNPATEISGTGSSCSGSLVKVQVTGVSTAPFAPLWRNHSPLYLAGAAADMVEVNSKCR